MSRRAVRVGSRGSALALRQAEIVMDAVRKAAPALEIELIPIATRGDEILDQSLVAAGGKGLFVKEIERALLDDRIDIAVHSYKDLPYAEAELLPVVALSERESPFDVLVLPEGADELDGSKPVGTSSNRRKIQLERLYMGCRVEPVRGNLQRRLSMLDGGAFAGLVLAQAGLNRLGLQNRISRVFSAGEMIPAASQGIIAVQGRKAEDFSYLAGFHSRTSEIVSTAERAFLKSLGADCSSPVAAYAELRGGELWLTGMYANGEGRLAKGEIAGKAGDAEALGETLAGQVCRELERR